MKRLLVTLLLLFATQSPALATPEAEATIPEAIKQFAQGRKKVRIAVFDFANTEEKKTRYDTYIADMLLSELSRYQMTLLERKRLEVLLGEHTLAQSGVIDQEKAQKLGEMLPVDLILSGSYTEFPGKVVIHARFINVGSGEIVSAFTSSFQVAPEQQNDQVAGTPLKKVCPLTKEEVQKLLYTLNTPKAVAKVVDQVIRIPFDTDCGAIHFEVIRSFKKHKIEDPRYKAFLLKTITNIESPSADYRAKEILSFFAADKVIDQEEWEAGLTTLKRMQISDSSEAVKYLLNAANEKSEILLERADTMMRLAAEGKMGRPVPVNQESMFFAVLHGMEAQSGRGDARNAVSFFRSYSNVVPDDDKNNKKAANILKMIYSKAGDREAAKGALSLLMEFYRGRTDTDVLAEHAADFIKGLESKGKERRGKDDGIIAAAREDIKTATSAIAELYCKSIEVAKKKKYHYIIEERSLTVLKNSMKCSHVPSVKEFEAEMRSGVWDRKLKAVEMLAKIGEGAKEAEPTIIRYLGQQGFGKDGATLRRNCAIVLGNIRSTNPEGIRLLIESLPEFDNSVSHEAMEAIKKIGADALPYLIQGLKHNDQAIRYRCVRAIGELRGKGKKALPELQQLSARDKDPYVRKEAAAVVQMIKNDF
jgi:TolB-like protein